MPGRIGEIFGSYELIQFLGRGGFAEVYLGKHTQLPQQMAAIKILDKQLVYNKSQQFQREASIVATLHHPNIVRMYDYNLYSNPNLTSTLVPYIIMEYAPNKSLRVKHPRGEPLPQKMLLTYTRQIADALQYAHEQHVMHLDVKPENILINAQQKLLLSDFGLATLLTEEEKTGDIQGTLSYMSPEQLDGKPVFASDQYALAVMVYEWVSGSLPFTGQSVKEVIEKHLKMPPPSLCARVSTLSPQAEAVIFRALAKDVRDRFSTIEDFALELDQALSSSAKGRPAAPVPTPRVNPFLPPQPNAGGPAPLAPNPVTPLPNALPNQLAPNLVQPFPQANQAAQPGQGAAFPNVSPGALNQAAQPGGILPLTPPGAGATPGGGLAASTPTPSNRAPMVTPDPLAALAANSPVTPPQPNQAPPAFPFPANPQPAGSFVAPNTGPGPFQAGPPPGSQVYAGSPFQPGLPPGAPVPAGSPFANPLASSPSATTVFGLPGSPPFPGQGGPLGPGPLPVYNTSGPILPEGQRLSGSLKSFLKRPPVPVRRRRLLYFVPGTPANIIGAILIGVWVSRTVHEHDTGWWAFLFATLLTVGAVVLFYNTGNRWLNSFLAAALAVYWGFVGVAIGALANGSFLPGPDVLAFLFFGISLALHLYLALRRR